MTQRHTTHADDDQTSTDNSANEGDPRPDGGVERVTRAVRDLACAARGGDADQIAIDVRVEEVGPVIVVEDDGRGMTPEQLDRFFAVDAEEEPFYGADEVHVATTRDGSTLKARSDDPPAFSVTEMDSARWENGTRVELVNVDAPRDLTRRIDDDDLRERASLGETEWTALVNVHVDDFAHTIRRLERSD